MSKRGISIHDLIMGGEQLTLMVTTTMGMVDGLCVNMSAEYEKG